MDDDSSDRALVRPYVPPGAEPTVSSIHQEEVPDAQPEPDPADERNTVVLPVAGPPPPAAQADGADRRPLLWLVGGGLALIAAAVVAIIALWPGGDESTPAALPGPRVVPSAGPAPATGSTLRPSASAKASASRSASATPSATGSPGRTTAPASSAPGSPRASATLAPPPAADRTGAITGPGGHCLDIRGAIALPGGALSAYACNNTLSQRWTLGADGTLRVSGMCAAPDGTAVHLGSCDASAQWRAGSGGTLVNVSAARCLTDPDNGATTGARMTLTACGGTGQHWTLP